ncbi:transcription factor with AP2 domain(s) [Plasmodium berghei]|uniref:Transcription factor with AP2 domain(S) n=1 Tax=Plasmodium berghei TaxID=5821 RepID=A0A1C6YS19_PLABE|nr:transcription factor with AP2 domain(s) [Plasmodium berghei]SCN28327.1 transcription factor with AP2 domain(s) [Plasmodium berghei]SCO62525.1 transcription factor with AP2 domain(s) [Plasmodium berghei]
MNNRGNYPQINDEMKCIENENMNCKLNNEHNTNYNNSQINSYNNNYSGVHENNELTNSNLCLNSNILQNNYYNNKIKDSQRYYKKRILIDHKNNMNNSEIHEYNCDSEKYREKMYSNSTINIGNYRNYINKDNCDYNINMYNNTNKIENTNIHMLNETNKNYNYPNNSKYHKIYTECNNDHISGENNYTKCLNSIINNGNIGDITKNNFPASNNNSANFNDQCNDIKNKNNSSNNFQQYNNSFVYGQNMSNEDSTNNNQYYEYVNHNFNMRLPNGTTNYLDNGISRNSSNSNNIKENYLLRNNMIHSLEDPRYNTNNSDNNNYEENSFNNHNYPNSSGEYNDNYRNEDRNIHGWNYNTYYNNNCNNPIGEDSDSNLGNNSDSNICNNTVTNSNNNTVNIMINNSNGTIMNSNTGDNNINDNVNNNVDTVLYKYNIKNNTDHMILFTDNEKGRFDSNNNIYMNNNYLTVDQCYANDTINGKNTSRCTNTSINIDSSNPTIATSSIYDDNTISNKTIGNNNYMFNVTTQNCDMINSNITTKYDTSFLSNFEQDDNECNTENDLDIDTVSDDYYNKTNYRYENISQRNSNNNAFDARDSGGSIANLDSINDSDLFNQYNNPGLNGIVNKFSGNTNINGHISRENSNGSNKKYSNSIPKNNEIAMRSYQTVGNYKQYSENKNFIYSDTDMCNNIENSRNAQDYENKLNGLNSQGVEITYIRKDDDNINTQNVKYNKYQKNDKLSINSISNNSNNNYIPSKSNNPSNYVLDNYNLNESCNILNNNGSITSLINISNSTDKLNNYNYNSLNNINMKDSNINMGHLEKYSINVVNNILITNPKEYKNSTQIENIENTQLLYNDGNNSDAMSATKCSNNNNGTNYRKMNNNIIFYHNKNIETKEGTYRICKNTNKNSVSGSIYNQLYDKTFESNNLPNYNIKNENIDNIAFLLNLNNQKNNRLSNNSKNYNNMNVMANDEHDTHYISSMNNMKNTNTKYYSNTNKNINSENTYDYLTNQPYDVNICTSSGSNNNINRDNNIYNGYGNKNNNDYTQWVLNSRHMGSEENKSSISMGNGYNANSYLVDNNNNMVHSNSRNANKSLPALCDNNMHNNYMPLKKYYENNYNSKNNNIRSNPNVCTDNSNDIDSDIANDMNNLNMLIIPKIKGVRFDKSGRRWVASWSQNGNQKRQYFPIKKFGKAQAKYLAIYARIKAVKCMQKKTNKNPENKRSYSKKLTNKDKTKQEKDETQNMEYFNDTGEDYTDKFIPYENNLCHNGSESSANKTDELYNESEDENYTKKFSRYMTEENYKLLAKVTSNTTEFNNYMNGHNKTENNLHTLSRDINQNENPTINTNIENGDDNTDKNSNSSSEVDDKQSCLEEKTNINNYIKETGNIQMEQYAHNINNNINNPSDSYNFNMNGNSLSEEKKDKIYEVPENTMNIEIPYSNLTNELKDNQNNTIQFGKCPNMVTNNNDITSNKFANNTNNNSNLKNDNENTEACENNIQNTLESINNTNSYSSEPSNTNNDQTGKGENLLLQINDEVNSNEQMLIQNEESSNATIKNDENASEKNDKEFYDPNVVTNNVNDNNINEKLKNMILLIERLNKKNMKIIKNTNEKINIQFIENEVTINNQNDNYINNIHQINTLNFNDKLLLLKMLKEYYMKGNCLKNNTSNDLAVNKGGNKLTNINQNFEPIEDRNTNTNNVDNVDISNQDDDNDDNNNLISEKLEKEIHSKSKKHTTERTYDNYADVNNKKVKTSYEDISNIMIQGVDKNDILSVKEKTNDITKSDGNSNNGLLNCGELQNNEVTNEMNKNKKNTNDSNIPDNGSTNIGLLAHVKNEIIKKLNDTISCKSNNQVEFKEDLKKNITEKGENTLIFKTNNQNHGDEEQQNDSYNVNSLNVKNDQENTTNDDAATISTSTASIKKIYNNEENINNKNNDKNEICDPDDLPKDIDCNIPNNNHSGQSNFFFKNYYTYENPNNVNNIGLNSNNNYEYNCNNSGNYQIDGNINNNCEENDGEDTNENHKHTKKVESLSSYPSTVINGICNKIPQINNVTSKELQFHDYTKQTSFNNNSLKHNNSYQDFSITSENANSKKFIPYNIGNKNNLTIASISTIHEPTDASTIGSPQRSYPNDHLICELNHEQNINDSKIDTSYYEGNKANFIRNVLHMNTGNDILINDTNELESDINDDAFNETHETTNMDEINKSRDYCNDLDKNQIDHSQYKQYTEHVKNNDKGHIIHAFPQYSFGNHYDSKNNFSKIIPTSEKGHNNGYPVIADTKNGLRNTKNMDNINDMSNNLSSNENTPNYVNINKEYKNVHISELTDIDRTRMSNIPYLIRNEYDNFYSKNDLFYDPNYSTHNKHIDSNNSNIIEKGNNILLQNGFNVDMNIPYMNLTSLPSSVIVNEQICIEEDQKNDISFLNTQLFNYKHNMDIMQNAMNPNNDHENVQHTGDNNGTLYNSRNNNTNNISDNAYNIPTNNTAYISQMEI